MFWRHRGLRIGLSSSTGNRRETVIVSLTRTPIVLIAAILALALPPTATNAQYLSPTALDFAPQEVGSTSYERWVTGFVVPPYIITGDFAQTNDCPKVWCTFRITFTPTAVGLRTGTLTFFTIGATGATELGQVFLFGTGIPSGKRGTRLKKCKRAHPKGSKKRELCIKQAKRLPV